MSLVRGLAKAAAGAGAGVALVTALPVFGAVGAITAAGLVVGSVLGATAAVADEVLEARKKKPDGDKQERSINR
jgi:hypothetical protein